MDRAARQGLGRRCWRMPPAWRGLRARGIAIEADPQAEPFYLAQGAVRVGARRAHSRRTGRALPLLRLPLNGGARASFGQRARPAGLAQLLAPVLLALAHVHPADTPAAGR